VRPIHLLIVLFALILVFALARERAAYATSRIRWLPDMTREQDSVPPSRPSVKLAAIHRAKGSRFVYVTVPRAGLPDTVILAVEQSSSADDGILQLLVRAHDDHALQDRLGWRARCVAGKLPGLDDIPLPGVEYYRHMDPSEAGPPGWSTVYFAWKDWTPGMGDARDSLHAGIVITCLDRVGNESEPSDTLWVDAPAR
jgi:hypothetical protein